MITTTTLPLYSPERLRSFFEPKSIALVGASEKSAWFNYVYSNLHGRNFAGEVYYINPRSQTIHGHPTVAHLAEIGKPVDLAFVMVPPDVVPGIFREIVAAGIHNAILLTSGFGEIDAAGRQRQQELADYAQENDLVFLGPNCMGYINFAHNIAAMPGIPSVPVVPGGIALISQSGALTANMLAYAYSQHIGLNALVSTGNEASLSISDVVNYFVDDESTHVIALFVESFRNPTGFREVAQRALHKGKPIVAFKIGRSEISANVAQAHTGSLVGDDRVIEALFRQSGVIRVDSLEELLITSSILAQTGVLSGRRLGFQSISGGACDMAADRAEQVGIEFPPFTPQTKQALAQLLPVLGAAHNPLDTTGAAITNAALYEQVLTVISKDPHLDIFLCAQGLPVNERELDGFGRTAEVLHNAPCPAYLFSNTGESIPEIAHMAIERYHLPYLPGGIYHGFAALARVMWWSERYRHEQEKAGESIEHIEPLGFGAGLAISESWSEDRTRTFLQEHDVPVVPALVVTSADEAAEAVRSQGFPVALKIVSPDILHKSDIGGVRLGLRDEGEVREAFQQIQEAAQRITPLPQIEGVLVSPMRSGGVELLIGVVRDAVWGQVLAVGLGGIWVEVLKDTSLRVLPVARTEIRAMLDELQGSALLRGARGTKPADIDALVEIIFRISTLAYSQGTELESLEINPLWVDGSQIEALDALITWS